MRLRILILMLLSGSCLPAVLVAQSTEICMMCHGDKSLTGSRDGKTISVFVDEKKFAASLHAGLSCTGCHVDVEQKEMPHAENLARVQCGNCHTDQQKLYSETLHGQAMAKNNLLAPRCADCHGSHDIVPVKDPLSAVAPQRFSLVCGKCHQEAARQYQRGIHGQLLAKNDANAPTCSECHTAHAIRSRQDPLSDTFALKVPNLCARCHRQGEKAAVRYTGTEKAAVEQYEESIHGQGLRNGLVVSATCTSCHTAHQELPHSDPASSVNNKNIPSTCGKCHYGIEQQFEQSIHSAAVSKTSLELPVCDTCHSAHTIRRADDQGFRLTIMSQCGQCHEATAKTYFNSYHGKVSQLGYTMTAKCYDCHGAHVILPASDPRSQLSQANVLATCQKCHAGATPGFTGYISHATHNDPEKYPWLFWAFWGMTALLVGTFTVSGAHTLLWLPRAVQMRRENPHIRTEGQAREFLRFSRLNRILHILMIVSFISLAFTGMTLKFSYTNWAAITSRLLGGFQSAGYIHRAAAILMAGVFFTHLYDLLRRRRTDFGSWRGLLFGPNSMLPKRKDLDDFVGSIKWFLGLGKRPNYGRWTYWEKFDYFAVFWGIAIIGSTGLILWLPIFFTRFLPGWAINVATIVHSDEALLAAGFIFTVHFFNTHLRPEKFPMDTVVFTGRMPLEEFKRDKPAEYQALVESGRLEEYLVEPYPEIVVKGVRFFAWTALAMGLIMVVWIVYAMLFASQ
jgi:cytochrome b subunit of formate dehydrogenase